MRLHAGSIKPAATGIDIWRNVLRFIWGEPRCLFSELRLHGWSKYSIDFGANNFELILQYLITLNRVAADLLVHVGSHTGEVSDVRLETGFAIAHGFGD